MKRIIIALMMVVGFAINSTAQTVTDNSGNLVATFEFSDSSATLKDGSGEVKLRMFPRGLVLNGSYGVVGFINDSIYNDPGGNLVGTVSASGEVKNEAGTVVGTIQNSKDVYDANGNLIGQASIATNMDWLASYFLLFAQ